MANKFPNLPGVVANINDNNLGGTNSSGGAVLAVLGTAQKGPSKVESLLLDGATAVTRFGAEGSLGRGLAEGFQGGATSAVGYRILATPGKLEHVGDVSGAEGITIETKDEGSDALSNYLALYDARTNRLRIYNANSNGLVYDATGSSVAVNTDSVIVTGTAASGSTDDGVAASIGLRVAVADDEADQVFTGAAGNPAAATGGGDVVFTLDSSISGFNLNRLTVSGDGSEYMLQIVDDLETVMEEWPVTAFDAGASTLTVNCGAGGDLTTGGSFRTAGSHKYRVVSRVSPQRLSTVLTDRLGVGGTSELRLIAGSDYNGAALTSGVGQADDGTLLNGVRVDASVDEAEPAKINLYEALVDAAIDLETSDSDALVLMDAYMDDPALDGQAVGETALPVELISDASGTASVVETSSVATVAKDPRRLTLTFGSSADATSALNALQAAGRGGSWFVATEAQGASFGENVESDEIVRTGRVLNWEGGKEVHTITAVADVADSLDGTYFLVPYDTDKAYKVWFDTDDSGTAEPALDAADAITFAAYTVTGVEVTGVATDDVASAVASAIGIALTGLSGISFEASGDVVTIMADVQGNLDAAVDADTTSTGFTFASTDGGNSLDIFFDRDMGFSVDSDGDVVGAKDFDYRIYETDLLFFHREKEVDGRIKHFWYSEKIDPEANSFNEVNFAFRLGTICHDMTQNENAVIGIMGVRPPSNHFSPAAVSSWIGKLPVYDSEGEVSLNGEGLLGNKFISGRGLNNVYVTANQFTPGFKATASGELDDASVLTDAGGFDIDLGKYLSIVASWPVMSNFADSSGLGYIASGAALYAGRLLGLPPWRGATAKQIGGSTIRLPVRLAKRHLDALTGARYVTFSERLGVTSVVDAPSAALPTSDFTRNMTVRMVFDAISRAREVARPFLGDPLSAARKAALETRLKKELSDLQQQSDGALERFDLVITQTPLDKVRGTAKASLALQIVNELRVLTFEVALTI